MKTDKSIHNSQPGIPNRSNLSEVITEFEAVEPYLKQAYDPAQFAPPKGMTLPAGAVELSIELLEAFELGEGYTLFPAVLVENGTMKPLWSLTKECSIDRRYPHITAARIQQMDGLDSEIVFFTDSFLNKLQRECNCDIGQVLNTNQVYAYKYSLIRRGVRGIERRWLFTYGIAIGCMEEGYIVFYDLKAMDVEKELVKFVKKRNNRTNP